MTDLHIKYRPQTLDDVIGQSAVVRSLRALEKAQWPHAFLFTGPSGCGKTTLARIISRALNVGRDGLIEIDAATNSGVDAMRLVLQNVQYKAMGDNPTKFVIVDECHALSKQTWQSLLLSIEEPPPHVYWALCTTEAHKVPRTIMTRCHTYQVKPVSPSLLGDFLTVITEEEGLKVAEDIVQLCAKEAGGSVRQALVNLSAARGAKDRKQAAQLLMAASEATEAVDLARMLVDGSASWDRCIDCIKALPEGETAESVRLVVLRYVQSTLLGEGRRRDPQRLLAVLEQFSNPFFQAEDKAPLLLAVGRLVI